MATHSSFLAGESQGQRSLAGYSPWGHKELHTIERLSTAQHTPRTWTKSVGMPHPADMNTVDSSDQSVGEGQFHPGGP